MSGRYRSNRKRSSSRSRRRDRRSSSGDRRNRNRSPARKTTSFTAGGQSSSYPPPLMAVELPKKDELSRSEMIELERDERFLVEVAYILGAKIGMDLRYSEKSRMQEYTTFFSNIHPAFLSGSCQGGSQDRIDHSCYQDLMRRLEELCILPEHYCNRLYRYQALPSFLATNLEEIFKFLRSPMCLDLYNDYDRDLNNRPNILNHFSAVLRSKARDYWREKEKLIDAFVRCQRQDDLPRNFVASRTKIPVRIFLGETFAGSNPPPTATFVSSVAPPQSTLPNLIAPPPGMPNMGLPPPSASQPLMPLSTTHIAPVGAVNGTATTFGTTGDLRPQQDAIMSLVVSNVMPSQGPRPLLTNTQQPLMPQQQFPPQTGPPPLVQQQPPPLMGTHPAMFSATPQTQQISNMQVPLMAPNSSIIPMQFSSSQQNGGPMKLLHNALPPHLMQNNPVPLMGQQQSYQGGQGLSDSLGTSLNMGGYSVPSSSMSGSGPYQGSAMPMNGPLGAVPLMSQQKRSAIPSLLDGMDDIVKPTSSNGLTSANAAQSCFSYIPPSNVRHKTKAPKSFNPRKDYDEFDFALR